MAKDTDIFFIQVRRDLNLVVRKQAAAYCDTKEVMMNCWARHCWGTYETTHNRKCVFFIDHGKDFKDHMKKEYNTEVEYADRNSAYASSYFATIKRFKDMLAENIQHGDQKNLLKSIHAVLN